jgi:TPR repeat protein/CHAT domain-containing protein
MVRSLRQLPCQIAVVLALGRPAAADAGKSPSPPPRVSEIEQECRQGKSSACYDLALAYDDRQVGPTESGALAARFYDLACSGGDLRGCDNLGAMYANGQGVTLDGPRAASLFESACNAGSMGACHNLAVLREQGLHVRQDAASAATLYKRACDAGLANSCHNLAGLYEEGKGVPRDPSKAAALYTRTCEAGFRDGCHDLGFLYEHGEGVPRDPARALALYVKSCEGGEPRGCHNAGLMLREGEGGAKDLDRALSYHQRACDGGFTPSCFDLGAMLHSGCCGGRDLRRAAAAYERACAGGHAAACRELGFLRGTEVDPDPAEAARLSRQACDGGDALGCNNLGVAYRDALGVVRDVSTAEQLFRKACEGGEAEGCHNLGVIRRDVAKDASSALEPFQKALALFTRGCDDGEAESCNSAGLMHVHGEGTPLDLTRAFSFYKRACEGGHAVGCNNLGYAYLRGRGVAADPSLAVSYFKKSCNDGHAMACQNLAAVLSPDTATTSPTSATQELRSRASTLTELGKSIEALSLLEQAVRLDEARGDEGRADLARDRMELGMRLSELGRTDEAIGALRQAEGAWAALDAPRDHVVCLATLGQVELQHDRHGDAEGHLSRALELARAHELTDALPVIHNNLGLVYQAMGRYQEALEHLLLSREGQEQRGDTHNAAAALGNIGWTYVALGRCEEGLASWQSALDTAERGGEAKDVTQMMVGLGLALADCGRSAEARARLEQGAARANKARQSDIEASALQGLGNLLGGEGLLVEAEAAYTKAIEIFRTLDSPRKLLAASSALGDVLRTWGRREEALKIYKDALAQAQALGLASEVVSSLLSVGEVHEDEGRINAAILLYRRALAIAEKDEGERQVVALHNAIGRAFTRWGKLDEGEKHLRTALALAERLSLPAETAGILIHLGGVAQMRGDIEGARRLAQRGLELARASKVRPDEASALNNLGLLELRPGHYQEAQKYLLEAISIKEQLRESAKGRDRITALDTWISSYRTLVLAHFLDGAPAAACDAGERIKARYLAEQLRERASSEAEVPTGIDATRSTLGEKTAIVSFLNVDWQHPLAVVATRTTIRAYAIDASGLRAKLESRSKRRASSASRGVPQVSRIPQAAEEQGDLPAMLADYRRLLSRPHPSPEKRRKREWLARSLFDVLLAPVQDVLAGIEELIVIPDGSLWAIPLETLRLPDGRYLVERHHLVYLPSLQVRALLARRSYGERPRSLLAIGGVPYGDPPKQQARASPPSRSQLGALRASAQERLGHGSNMREVYAALGYGAWTTLPSTQLEVDAIARIVPGSTVLSGAHASEKRVKDLSRNGTLRGYRVLHFATHGLLVPDAPELSALVLAESAGGASDEDGYLSAAEIAKLDIQADFVSLSACETGLGKIYGGDGAVGLTQAFLEAGANGVAVSLWQVNDAPTKDFMVGLYEQVQQGATYARAMTEVKRRAIHSAALQEPCYWAPFVYYGR